VPRGAAASVLPAPLQSTVKQTTAGEALTTAWTLHCMTLQRRHLHSGLPFSSHAWANALHCKLC